MHPFSKYRTCEFTHTRARAHTMIRDASFLDAIAAAACCVTAIRTYAPASAANQCPRTVIFHDIEFVRRTPKRVHLPRAFMSAHKGPSCIFNSFDIWSLSFTRGREGGTRGRKNATSIHAIARPKDRERAIAFDPMIQFALLILFHTLAYTYASGRIFIIFYIRISIIL